MDIKSRLNTEGKFGLGLNYTLEETYDPSSRPCEPNAATWKAADERSLHVGLGQGSRKV